MSHIVLKPGTDPGPYARRLAAEGWRPHQGFHVPEEPWELAAARHVAVGAVRTAEEAAAALMLAVRGALLVVSIESDERWAQEFRADLRRISGAPVPAAPAVPAIPLDQEQRQILDLLAQGRSIAAAAEELFISLRTANRRIAAARKALQAATTSEAVVAYTRLRRSGSEKA